MALDLGINTAGTREVLSKAVNAEMALKPEIFDNPQFQGLFAHWAVASGPGAHAKPVQTRPQMTPHNQQVKLSGYVCNISIVYLC